MRRVDQAWERSSDYATTLIRYSDVLSGSRVCLPQLRFARHERRYGFITKALPGVAMGWEGINGRVEGPYRSPLGPGLDLGGRQRRRQLFAWLVDSLDCSDGAALLVGVAAAGLLPTTEPVLFHCVMMARVSRFVRTVRRRPRFMRTAEC